ncbi:nitrogen regulation protein NR(II) [Pseudoalteromonas tunicata]|jgi:two-component system nitrogen regulation sensor histidine kinase GlnL|uniref:Sensory histidine kinase/phosphatase NtrB n=1 Tax=Pseudoalteromonas tunicata D2 TaxID=87626 RepID=A4C7T6_9GAMM|nr:nitrogen regulation protein NR(II) [Pseudoalteromonas tunicata]ATC93156.1 two-component system, NtrC family, nitrogen regulation sensor histidine kinase GlnL [Pseudoalteromonas tunicata]AXT32227.1 nitrogen regulation protein NR(II) [Pseudoalteromonas tunicata]EAR28651.1 nitrogen availability sensory kinase (soluble) in two-component regulatory system with GlnG, nitrogen regulation [Pseudoalteromonas tunicata D2]MDP5212710.1 nitrogen regulation protein NR(II) [Pseudoalteromonas tunicata]
MRNNKTLTKQALQILSENLATAVILLNQDLQVVYANDSASELFALGPKRFIDQQFESLFNYHTIDVKRIISHTLIEGSDCHQHRADAVFLDSRHAKITLNSRRLMLENQPFILLECRALDDEIKHDKASHQMHQYMAARTLIRGLAHEIKNPLGGIRGAAQLLQYEVDQQERDECATLIIEQADRLTELVDRLLGPNQLPKKAWCNIHQTLESVVKLTTLSNQSNITLLKDYDPSIPDIFIDQGKIQQVVLNIVRNAQQALVDGGQITLQTRIRHHMRVHNKAMKNALLIKVSDNGPGIDKALRDTLFYPMVTNKEGGSGLGLAIAQTLIDQHDGYIECESWPGHTEFNIYLPFASTK